MEQGWTQHPKGHNRHPQRGQRSLHALASGPSYQGSSRRRWCHPDSYSSDGKEHFGSGRQKACPTANSTRSRETRTTSHRDEIRWELQPHLPSLIGTLSTGLGYVYPICTKEPLRKSNFVGYNPLVAGWGALRYSK
ncbi:uncharacterized protein LOC143304569 [Bombus vancouverensis nearcticus]|uniref:uncharacterized protein LOC143304569 n=1 Tax=Bombus vancouverensis nearcticus TaxID=2705178 RepID=UPI00402B160A